jgi:YHS domain-containing protein
VAALVNAPCVAYRDYNKDEGRKNVNEARRFAQDRRIHWLGALTVMMGIGLCIGCSLASTETAAGDTAGPPEAQHLVNVAGASGVALDGYDPVAFFTEGKAVNGDHTISSTHKGATYFFASKEHREAFEADQEAYVPQFGGYCAYGVAKGGLFPVDITTWQIRDGKLYLNLNPAMVEQFNKDLEGNVARAQRNWPELVKQKGR